LSVPDPHPRRLPSGRHGLPRELVAQYQRQRLLEAAIQVAGERGFDKMAVAQILEVAGISRTTFYELFEDKLACFLAAYEMAIDSLVAEVRSVCDHDGEWRERVRAGLAAVLERFAAEPALARVALVEISAAGPAGKRRYRAALQRFAPFLEEGLEQSALGAELSARTTQMAVGGAVSVISRELVAGRAAQLPRALGEAVFAALLPILGPQEARAEIERSRRG
jgi:AcrR family transcriptional regulator